MMFLECDLDP